jgi:hypothetical protein
VLSVYYKRVTSCTHIINLMLVEVGGIEPPYSLST